MKSAPDRPMTFCIELEREGERTVLRIAGRLTGEGVPEVRTACARARAPLVLDLTDLTSADAEARQVLLELRRTGVQLRGASPYLCLLLESGSEGS